MSLFLLRYGIQKDSSAGTVRYATSVLAVTDHAMSVVQNVTYMQFESEVQRCPFAFDATQSTLRTSFPSIFTSRPSRPPSDWSYPASVRLLRLADRKLVFNL